MKEAEELRRLLVRVAGEAAAYLRDRLGSVERLEVIARSERDETLGIDYEVEGFVIELLRAEGINARVICEERGEVVLGAEPRLVILLDPLDGSKNYAAFVPWAAVSIAAAPAAHELITLDELVAGVVAPIFNWPPISFAKGAGVFEGNSTPLRTPIQRILLYYAESAEQLRVIERVVNAFRSRGYRVSSRSYGAAALEITWAALGRALAFIDLRGKLRNVDVAAALGIAREAGAYIHVERELINARRVEEVGSVIVAPRETSIIIEDAIKGGLATGARMH